MKAKLYETDELDIKLPSVLETYMIYGGTQRCKTINKRRTDLAYIGCGESHGVKERDSS